MLENKILEHLSATAIPLSVAELGRALPAAASAEIEHACYLLRTQRRLGRNGANTPASPYRYYLKQNLDAPV
jgi:hypothetical protein